MYCKEIIPKIRRKYLFDNFAHKITPLYTCHSLLKGPGIHVNLLLWLLQQFSSTGNVHANPYGHAEHYHHNTDLVKDYNSFRENTSIFRCTVLKNCPQWLKSPTVLLTHWFFSLKKATYTKKIGWLGKFFVGCRVAWKSIKSPILTFYRHFFS